MEIVFSKHAQERMFTRNVDETEVELTVKSPDRRLFTARNRRIVYKLLHDRIIIIVYTVERGTIFIITTMVYE